MTFKLITISIIVLLSGIPVKESTIQERLTEESKDIHPSLIEINSDKNFGTAKYETMYIEEIISNNLDHTSSFDKITSSEFINLSHNIDTDLKDNKYFSSTGALTEVSTKSMEIISVSTTAAVATEYFEENEMEHFSIKEEQTICASCNDTTFENYLSAKDTLELHTMASTYDKQNEKWIAHSTVEGVGTAGYISLSDMGTVLTDHSKFTNDFELLKTMSEFTENFTETSVYIEDLTATGEIIISKEFENDFETNAKTQKTPTEIKYKSTLSENFEGHKTTEKVAETVSFKTSISFPGDQNKEVQRLNNTTEESQQYMIQTSGESEDKTLILEHYEEHTVQEELSSNSYSLTSSHNYKNIEEEETTIGENRTEIETEIPRTTKTFKISTLPTALNLSTTFMLLLSSVYGTNLEMSNSTTMPSVYVDLPVFLPNGSSSIGHEFATLPTSSLQNHHVKIYSNNSTETLILFLDGPNDGEMKKLNGTKWFRRLDEFDVTFQEMTSELPQPQKISENKNELPKYIALNECKKSDFENNDKCFCAIDNILTTIKNNDSHKINCLDFLKVHNEILIGNESVAHVRKRRSYLFGKYDIKVKREIVDYSKTFFEEEFKIQNSDVLIYALPGTRVVVPCKIGDKNVEVNQYVKYSWLFKDENSVPDNQVEENTGNLILDNTMPKDSGNYTCVIKSRLNEKSNLVQKYYHRLVIVTTPIYKISINIMYDLREPCDLSDGDVISTYLPHILNGLLCGYKEKMCKVDVRRPVCVNKEQEKLINVTFTACMLPLKEILPTIDVKSCNLNCQVELYSKLAAILMKNIKTFANLSIYSKHFLKDQEFTPKQIAHIKDHQMGRWSSPPILIAICPAGFGIEKKEPRICVVCPENTYNPGQESYCKICPSGQYQPVAGSMSCITCSSPLENIACLSILYSNTQYFKVYVGVAMSFVLVLILIIFYCTRNSPPNPANTKRHDYVYSMLRKDADIETGVNEPLLKRQNVPPQLPPRDF